MISDDTVLALERRVWDALVKGDAVADAAALAPEFLGIYSDGFAGRAEHVDQLSHGPSVLDYDLADVRVLRLGTDHASISYRATFTRRDVGAISETMFVTSIWENRDGHWVNILSQDTPHLLK